MSSFPVRAADERLQATSFDAAGSDDALGYSGIDRDGVAGPCLAVASEHVGGDREDHSCRCGRHHGIRDRAHGAALQAAVVIGSGRARIGRPVLSMHSVMVVFAVTSVLTVMACDVGAVLDAGCGDRRQLQPGALPPGRRAGDQREREGQNQNVAKNATHTVMLTGRVGSRQQIFVRFAVDL